MIDLNSSSKTDESSKEFRLTDKDEEIVKLFMNNNNEPKYAAEIARKTAITRKWAGDRCKILKDQGLLLSEIKYANRRGDTDHYYLNELADVLIFLDMHLNSNFIIEVIRTDYYRKQIGNLIKRFDNNLKLAGHKGLTISDKEALQISLRYSTICLRIVLFLKDFEIHSSEFIKMYKNQKYDSLQSGSIVTLRAVDEIIFKTKLLGDKEKPVLRKEIYGACSSVFNDYRKEMFDLCEKNMIPFLCDDFMNRDPSAYYYIKFDEIEQFELDKEKLRRMHNIIMNEYLDVTNLKCCKNE